MSFFHQLFFLSISLTHVAHAASLVTATITPTVASIDEISLQPYVGPLLPTPAQPGSDPGMATALSYYAISTNNFSRQLQANLLSGSLPNGLSCSVYFFAPHSGGSVGTVPLTINPTAVLSGIGPGFQNNVQIIFTMQPTIQADTKTDSFIVQYQLIP